MNDEGFNSVTLLAIITGYAAFSFRFVTYRANRLVSGSPVFIWERGGLLIALIIFFLLSFNLVIFFLARGKRYTKHLFALTGDFLLILPFIVLGLLSKNTDAITRVSPSIGFWLIIFCGYLFILSSVKKLTSARLFFTLFPVLAILFLIFSGYLNRVSILVEYFSKKGRFLQELTQHLYLTGFSISIALVLGVPLGFIMFKSKKLEKPIYAFINLVQTIPSLALFGLLIAPISLLTVRFPVLRTMGIQGIGSTPAIIALFLYALLPITSNTFTGLKVVEPAIVEAGIGMGMNKIQLLFRIEIPLAFPVIFNGIRTSLVQTIGNTTVAALIGAGGLGTFVFQGLGQGVSDLILLGALPIILLAILVDRSMYLINRILTPRGLKV